MRLTKHPRKRRMEMDMTPMIDVAFQLIIFFMTVSQMSEVSREPVQLPKQAGEEQEQPKTLIINVTEDGEYRVAGEPISTAGFVSLVSEEVQRAGDDPNQVVVVVRADERGASRGVNDVVTAMGTLGITRVRIAVQAAE
ncbi:MAG: ExbD/TolR family protein [Pirellulaceae bacterium]